MIIDTTSPLNQGVLGYLSRGEKSQNVMLAAPDSVPYPHMTQGSHPDIVSRVWDELGVTLPGKCQCLVYGTPAMVHDSSGIIIALCNGTQYNLLLTAADFKEAIALGASTRTQWSNGTEMDSLEVLGPNWIFGGWLKEENLWLSNTYDQCSGVKQN